MMLCFLAGSQVTHYCMNPLGDLDDVVNEKKAKLWQNYLQTKSNLQSETKNE